MGNQTPLEAQQLSADFLDVPQDQLYQPLIKNKLAIKRVAMPLQQIKNLMTSKLNLWTRVKLPNLITPLSHKVISNEQVLCSQNVLLQIAYKKTDFVFSSQIIKRKKQKRYFTQLQLIHILLGCTLALQQLRSLQLTYGCVKTSNIRVLSDSAYLVCPLLAEGLTNSQILQQFKSSSKYTSGIYIAPQKLNTFKAPSFIISGDNCNQREMKSDLFTLGMCILQGALLQKLDQSYKNNLQQIDFIYINNKIQSIQQGYPKIAKYLRLTVAFYFKRCSPKTLLQTLQFDGFYQPTPKSKTFLEISDETLQSCRYTKERNDLFSKRNSQNLIQKQRTIVLKNQYLNKQNMVESVQLPTQAQSKNKQTTLIHTLRLFPVQHLHKNQQLQSHPNFTQQKLFQRQTVRLQPLQPAPLKPLKWISLNTQPRSCQNICQIKLNQIRGDSCATSVFQSREQTLRQQENLKHINIEKQQSSISFSQRNSTSRDLFNKTIILDGLQDFTVQSKQRSFNPHSIESFRAKDHKINTLLNAKPDFLIIKPIPPSLAYEPKSSLYGAPESQYVCKSFQEDKIQEKSQSVRASMTSEISIRRVEMNSYCSGQLYQIPSKNTSKIEDSLSQQSKLASIQEDGSFCQNSQIYQNYYEGQTKDGLQHGYGKFYYSDGGYYQGEWHQGKMQGDGKLYYQNGKLAYQGQWQDNKFHGQGILFNNKEQQLSKPFQFNNLNLIQQFWVYYEGEFQNDLKQGEGKLFLTNGQHFQGQFQGDWAHGRGTFSRMNGQKILGVWKNGILKEKYN